LINLVYCTRRPVPQKETSHWWQRKHKPAKTNENPVPNQVAVAVPVPIHQKVIIIILFLINNLS